MARTLTAVAIGTIIGSLIGLMIAHHILMVTSAMKVQIFDSETGSPVGEKEVPDDVILAAQKVEHWMLAQSSPHSIILHGLRLTQE